ncbi:ABC transporter ATP-binding protein [Salisaeta longa]|uniref:ABC transporter ATP-binding protein n=1 Tax=Salisaeta longa TaxID=503170 RepID=UPI0003B34837|nr:ABC transporter ATP-binding protein [Salisaeta longa]
METLRDIARYLRIYRRYIGRRMYLVFALTITTALAQGFGITLLLPLLQASQATSSAPADMSTAERWLQTLLQWMGIADSMIGILGFIAVVFVGKGLLQFANGGYQGYLQSRLLRELKRRLFDAYQQMDYRYYIQHNTGHFINVINGQINQFFASFGSFAGFLTQIITTISYFAFAFAITWRFSLMAIGVGAVLFALFRRLNVYVRTLSRKRSQEMSQLNKLLVQGLQSFKYIASTNQGAHLRTGVMESIQRLTHYIFRQRVAGAFTAALKEPFSVLLIVSLIAIQVTVFEAPVAPIFVALLLFHRGMQALISMQSGFQMMMDRIGAVEMVDEEFAEVTRHQERQGGQTIGTLETALTCEDVSFAYDPSEGPVLRDINITIPANTTVAFVGESGAGKSTLVDLFTYLLKPQQGTVRIDGVPAETIDLASWRAQIGYVSQETVVFDDTIAHNISLWAGDMTQDAALDERVRDAARRAHADHFIRALPQGYQTVVGDRGVRLSGGQRQRLFIARELFKQPNLLILDEATSALDTESERYIQQSIDALKGEMTVVIIAHRLSTIKNVDHVYVLDDGRIVEEGPYEALRLHEGSRFREMVEMQSL